MKEKKEKKVPVINKKTTLAIIASVCAVLLLVTLTVSLVLVFGNKTNVPTPKFADFDDENDYYIRVKWDKIRGAIGYSYVYWYGDPAGVDESKFTVCKTTNTVTTFSRQKGKVAFKVKADIVGEKTRYSDWIYLDISAWQIQKPILTIGENLDVSWVESTFKADDKSYKVRGYEYNVLVDGEEIISENLFVSTNKVDLKKFVVEWLKNDSDKVDDYMLGGKWQDIEIEVKVKAVAYDKFGGVMLSNPVSPYDVLMNAYSDSDYASASVTVTEALFNKLQNGA